MAAWEELSKFSCQQLKPSHLNFKTISGSGLIIEGEVTLDLEELGRHTLYVCNGLSYHVLLGADVLEGSVINMPEKIIHVKDRSLSIYAFEENMHKVPMIAEAGLVDIPDFLKTVANHPVFREELGHCTVGEPAVITTTGPPIKQKAYRLPLTKRAVVEEEVGKDAAAWCHQAITITLCFA